MFPDVKQGLTAFPLWLLCIANGITFKKLKTSGMLCEKGAGVPATERHSRAETSGGQLFERDGANNSSFRERGRGLMDDLAEKKKSE